MSVKYWNKKEKKWVIFPGTVGAPGKDAYTLAIENGYEGNRDDYIYALVNIPKIVNWFENTDDYPTENSKNLVYSGGVWSAINDLDGKLSGDITKLRTDLTNEILRLDSELSSEITTVNDNLLNKISQLDTKFTNEINNLDTKLTNKINSVESSLTNEINDLTEQIANINSSVSGDLSSILDKFNNYYTKSETYDRTTIDEMIGNLSEDIGSLTIPDITITKNGGGNVISNITSSKHTITATTINVYTTDQIDTKLEQITGSVAGGDVMAESTWGAINRVIVSSNTSKTVKDSGIAISDLVLSSSLGDLALKDKVDISDCNFDIPEGPVIDSVLSSSSTNAVQNKVIYAKFQKYYTKTEIDGKISAAGGGDVLASGTLASDMIILGGGNKTIKSSGVTLSSIQDKLEELESGAAGNGTVKSVAMTVPAGFSISGSPITTTGTLALSFASGYSLPTKAKQTNWDTAYGWGNHASAGYSKVQALSGSSVNVSTIADEAYIVVAGNATVSFTGGTCYKTEDPVGTSSQKKCYCIKKISGGYLINAALYD